MIKVGIIGADTPDGGELIRLLAMHPDVEIMAAQAQGLEGVPVSHHHHGLIGETSLAFSGSLDYSRINVLFVCSQVSFGAAEFTQMRIVRPDLKVIMLRKPIGLDMASQGIVYGLPELNRKLLVRGATGATVPAPFASMALVALYPFASHMLLGDDIAIELAAPKAILESTDMGEVKREIEGVLNEMQRSFTGKVTIEAKPSEARRSGLMKITFKCTLTPGQLMSLYDIYDDHNFAFATSVPFGVSEVAGTNKCVINVGRNADGHAELRVAADCRLRGGAGEAVHILNLMFGLHERTGLALKAIDFEPVE